MSRGLKIFLLAGVQTKPSAFQALSEQLKERLALRGFMPEIEILFPYGDAERKLWKQVLEVGIDLRYKGFYKGIGGKKVWHLVEPHIHSSKLLFIGHSGGGIAAYQIAKHIYHLYQSHFESLGVIQIGSPKIKIANPLKNHVAYIHAIDEQGQLKDPISKLGNWGGWNAKAKPMRIFWDKHKHAPKHVHGIETIGGHADYFRIAPTFRDAQQRCNLDKTMQSIEKWLNEWL